MVTAEVKTKTNKNKTNLSPQGAYTLVNLVRDTHRKQWGKFKMKKIYEYLGKETFVPLSAFRSCWRM